MKITYITQSTELWGGIYVVFQHLQLLAEAGHNVFLTTPADRPDWYPLSVPIHHVSHLAADLIPEADIVVATSWTTIKPVVDSKKGIPVHLCQGLEYDYKELGPHKAAIEAVYAFPIPKMTVAPHLDTALRARFKGETYCVGQMVDRNIFYPPQAPNPKAFDKPFSILVVGPFQADFKNIRAALKGIAIAKQAYEIPIKLIRVSQFPLSEEEKEIIVPDEYHFHVPYIEMAHFYRRADLLVSMSKEAEGFGLPAIEAMACGTPTILSRIPSYTSFDPVADYARFVDPLDFEALSDAIVETAGNRSLREDLIRGGLRVAGKFTKERLQDRLTTALTSIREKGALQKAREFWDGYHANRTPDVRVSWWESPVIVEACQERITGDPKMTIHEFLKQYLPDQGRPFERGLSVCCGSGEFERELIDHGLCRAIDAFDIAEERVKEGMRIAGEQGYAIRFRVADVNRSVFETNHYDAFFAWSALHHIQNLEGVCNRVADALRDNGLVVIQEYVGPNRFQWRDKQLAVANRILSLLPQRLRTSVRTGEVISRIERPTLETIKRNDPSEAIRSEDIIPVVERCFSIEAIRYFGGPIYHMLFNEIVGNFDPTDEKDTALIRLILLFEQTLIEEGILDNDYALIIARKKAI